MTGCLFPTCSNSATRCGDSIVMFSVFLCCLDMLVDTGDVCAGGVWEDVWESQEPHSADANWIQVDPFPGLQPDWLSSERSASTMHNRNEMKGVQVRTWVFHACKDGYIGLSKLWFHSMIHRVEFDEELLFFLFLGMTGMAAHQLLRRLYGKCGLVQPYKSKATDGEGMTWARPSGSQVVW